VKIGKTLGVGTGSELLRDMKIREERPAGRKKESHVATLSDLGVAKTQLSGLTESAESTCTARSVLRDRSACRLQCRTKDLLVLFKRVGTLAG